RPECPFRLRPAVLVPPRLSPLIQGHTADATEEDDERRGRQVTDRRPIAQCHARHHRPTAPCPEPVSFFSLLNLCKQSDCSTLLRGMLASGRPRPPHGAYDYFYRPQVGSPVGAGLALGLGPPCRLASSLRTSDFRSSALFWSWRNIFGCAFSASSWKTTW